MRQHRLTLAAEGVARPIAVILETAVDRQAEAGSSGGGGGGGRPTWERTLPAPNPARTSDCIIFYVSTYTMTLLRVCSQAISLQKFRGCHQLRGFERAARPQVRAAASSAASKYATLPSEQQRQVDAFLDVLLDWNTRMNLTGTPSSVFFVLPSSRRATSIRSSAPGRWMQP